MIWEYRKFRVRKGEWPAVRHALRVEGAAAIVPHGATVYGVWRGLIGAGDDEGIVISAWPDRETLAAHGASTLGSIDAVTESTHFARLQATVRPRDTVPPSEPGVYAHRWFSLSPEDWPEFLQLSEGVIWPHVETFDARVIGFWRNLDVPDHEARVLLVTRYGSMTEWERTRMVEATAPAGADPELYEGARAAVRRRHELTNWTIVRVYAIPGGL